MTTAPIGPSKGMPTPPKGLTTPVVDPSQDDVPLRSLPRTYPREHSHKSFSTKRKRSKPAEGPEPPLKRPSKVAGNKNASVTSSYFVDIFPRGETTRWPTKVDRARAVTYHLGLALAGIAPLLEEQLEGNDAEVESLKEKVKEGEERLSKLQKTLDLQKAEQEKLRSKLKAKDTELKVKEAELKAKDVELEKLRLSVDERIVRARAEGLPSFLGSDLGCRFVDRYRHELLSRYHDSRAYLERICTACRLYFHEGIHRTLAKVKDEGAAISVDEAKELEMMVGLPTPAGWNGDPSLPSTHPWWEPALDTAAKAIAADIGLKVERVLEPEDNGLPS